jgi:hypothetical protein
MHPAVNFQLHPTASLPARERSFCFGVSFCECFLTFSNISVPKDLKYAKSHEWIRVQGNVGTVGITAEASRQLGDIVFVEVPRAYLPQSSSYRVCTTVWFIQGFSNAWFPE